MKLHNKLGNSHLVDKIVKECFLVEVGACLHAANNRQNGSRQLEYHFISFFLPRFWLTFTVPAVIDAKQSGRISSFKPL